MDSREGLDFEIGQRITLVLGEIAHVLLNKFDVLDDLVRYRRDDLFDPLR
jgi:hypothetical protein